MELKDLDPAAANNSSPAPNGAPEGMPYPMTNDVGREMMAATARALQDHNGSVTSTGAGGAYAVTPVRQLSSLEDGLTFAFKANHSYTGTSATLKLNGVSGYVSLNNPHNADSVVLTAGAVYLVIYKNSYWHLISASAAYDFARPVKIVSNSSYSITDEDADYLLYFTGDNLIRFAQFTNEKFTILIPNKAVDFTYFKPLVRNGVVVITSADTVTIPSCTIIECTIYNTTTGSAVMRSS